MSPISRPDLLFVALALAGCGGSRGNKDAPQPECDPAERIRVYEDEDADGFGLRDEGLVCEIEPGLVTVLGDCNDQDPLVNPTVAEVCDGIDNNCDFQVDEGLPPAVWYADRDGDGYGNAAETSEGCGPPDGFVADGTDCDDQAPYVHPGATELCNGGVDDDCDQVAEEPDSFDQEWYNDNDNDGSGAGPSVGFGCMPPTPDAAPASAGVDCDDDDPFRYPGAPEICEDLVDQDCDGGDQDCGPVGSFLVHDGPDWNTDPPVYSCIEACALIFGGVATDWHCSTSDVLQNNQAYVSGFGDSTYCSTPVADTYSLEPVGNPGYACYGVSGCAYSAYVRDHCDPALGFNSTNWCWAR